MHAHTLAHLYTHAGTAHSYAFITNIISFFTLAAWLHITLTDSYEEEGDFFFEDLSSQVIKDDKLMRLCTFPNVVITGHQVIYRYILFTRARAHARTCTRTHARARTTRSRTCTRTRTRAHTRAHAHAHAHAHDEHTHAHACTGWHIHTNIRTHGTGTHSFRRAEAHAFLFFLGVLHTHRTRADRHRDADEHRRLPQGQHQQAERSQRAEREAPRLCRAACKELKVSVGKPWKFTQWRMRYFHWLFSCYFSWKTSSSASIKSAHRARSPYVVSCFIHSSPRAQFSVWYVPVQNWHYIYPLKKANVRMFFECYPLPSNFRWCNGTVNRKIQTRRSPFKSLIKCLSMSHWRYV